MRTTLTLEPDVAERLRQRMRTGKTSFKQVVNEALRRGLGVRPAEKQRMFKVRPHSSPFVPGIDPAKLNQTADELDAEATFPRRTR